jgi:hypothetical protein
MSAAYELAPATALLATSCAACGRPLLDAASVAAHMGPECRQKYGVLSLDEETRTAANVHIFRIALLQTGAEVAERLSALRDLGLSDLADRITKRLAPDYAAVISTDGDRLVVKASYDVAMACNLGLLPGRVWDKAKKVNTFPVSSKRALFEALKKGARGQKCLGGRGEFQL